MEGDEYLVLVMREWVALRKTVLDVDQWSRHDVVFHGDGRFVLVGKLWWKQVGFEIYVKRRLWSRKYEGE